MLKQNPKTLIQANQVQVYLDNHEQFAGANNLDCVLEGLKKLESYIQRLTEQNIEMTRDMI